MVCAVFVGRVYTDVLKYALTLCCAVSVGIVFKDICGQLCQCAFKDMCAYALKKTALQTTISASYCLFTRVVIEP